MAIKEAKDQMEKKPTNHLLRMLGIFLFFLKKIITSLMVILKLHEMLLALNVYHRRCFYGKYRESSNMTNNPLFGPMAKLELELPRRSS